MQKAGEDELRPLSKFGTYYHELIWLFVALDLLFLQVASLTSIERRVQTWTRGQALPADASEARRRCVWWILWLEYRWVKCILSQSECVCVWSSCWKQFQVTGRNQAGRQEAKRDTGRMISIKRSSSSSGFRWNTWSVLKSGAACTTIAAAASRWHGCWLTSLSPGVCVPGMFSVCVDTLCNTTWTARP